MNQNWFEDTDGKYTKEFCRVAQVVKELIVNNRSMLDHGTAELARLIVRELAHTQGYVPATTGSWVLNPHDPESYSIEYYRCVQIVNRNLLADLHLLLVQKNPITTASLMMRELAITMHLEPRATVSA